MMYFFVILLIMFFPAFADSDNGLELTDTSTYNLKIDEHEFDIIYQVKANVIAMAIDNELNSLLIGLENSKDSIMVIQLDDRLINATNNEFAILVNGYEVNYDITSDSQSTTLSFFVPAFTEEVEIIGTHVVPEFPLGTILFLSMIIPIMLIISKTKISLFRL